MKRTIPLLLPCLVLALGLAATAPGQNSPGVAGPAVEGPRDLCVLTASFLVGGFGQGKWLSAAQILPFIRGGETYRRFSQTGSTGDSRGGKPVLEEGPGEWYRVPAEGIDGADPAGPDGGSVVSGEAEVGVSCSWQPNPRPAKALGAKNPAYLAAIGEILRANALKAEPRLREVYRFDLEGDGVDEVLIVATNADASVPRFVKDTYTLVVFRQVVGGKVVTTLLHEEYYREDRSGEADSPSSYSFAGVLDLNGDGILELILRNGYYEGSGIEVHALEGKKLKLVLNEGVGA